MTVAAIGALVALSVLPQTWKVLWAPLVDTTLSPKLWYLIGASVRGPDHPRHERDPASRPRPCPCCRPWW